MIDRCSDYVKNSLLDVLARSDHFFFTFILNVSSWSLLSIINKFLYYSRRGIFTSLELGNFRLLLSRLSRIHASLDSDSHPLKIQNVASLDPFHESVIQLCQVEDLPQLLSFYLDQWG